MHPSDVMNRSWALYRAHWRHLIPIAAVVYVPLGGLSALLALAGWPGVVIANLLNTAAIFLVQGALVSTVERLSAGARPPGVAASLGGAGARLGALAAAGVLAALGILVGLLILIVPGLILLTRWLLLSPVIMLEHRRALEAFGRSRELVAGHGWQVFGVVVLTLLVLLALSLALGLAVTALSAPARGFLQVAVGSSLGAPLIALAWTLSYRELRAAEDRRSAG